MVNTFELDHFKKFIQNPTIDLQFVLDTEDLSDKHYSMPPKRSTLIESFIDEDGTFIPEYYQNDTIWLLTINDRAISKFQEWYQLAEDRLLEELDLNFKIADLRNEVESIYHEALSYLKSELERFNYNTSTGAIEYSGLLYGSHYQKYKHISTFDGVISGFLKNYQVLISLTISKILNKLEIPKGRSHLIWCKNDTDLLELITALLETRSITNSKGDLTRKEAIDFFSEVFSLPIKDAESKLTRATNRKKDVSAYLTRLKAAFDDYALRKEQKLDEIRG